MPDREISIESLLKDQIDTLEKNMSQRLSTTETTFKEWLTRQDAMLAEIKKQTQLTNGRVTALEKVRERAQGVMFAFKWMPGLLTAAVTAGLTILTLAITGQIH